MCAIFSILCYAAPSASKDFPGISRLLSGAFLSALPLLPASPTRHILWAALRYSGTLKGRSNGLCTARKPVSHRCLSALCPAPGSYMSLEFFLSVSSWFASFLQKLTFLIFHIFHYLNMITISILVLHS